MDWCLADDTLKIIVGAHEGKRSASTGVKRPEYTPFNAATPTLAVIKANIGGTRLE